MNGLRGTLVLVPNALDLGEPAPPGIELVLPAGVLATAAGLRHWIVENAKTARAFLKRVDAIHPLGAALQSIDIVELPRVRKGSSEAAAPLDALLAPALGGADIGLLSEAGLPAVADPGAALVATAHRLGVPVRPLPGPSALLLALAASGLEGQRFAFVGYVPQQEPERSARLRQLEERSHRERETQILIETPYRNAALLAALLAALRPTTRLALSVGLTLPGAWTRSDSVAGWRSAAVTLPDDRPAVFCLLAG